MRIYILLLLGLIISGCASNSKDLTADINFASLNAKSESKFRENPEINFVIKGGFFKEYILQEPANVIWGRVKKCYSNDKDFWLIKDSVTVITYEQTLVGIMYAPVFVPFVGGYTIASVITVDKISNNSSKARFYVSPKHGGLSGTEALLDMFPPLFEKNIRSEGCPEDPVLSIYG
jgi:hypothetical protein